MPLVNASSRGGPLRRCAGTSPVLGRVVGGVVDRVVGGAVGRVGSETTNNGPPRLGRWAPLARSVWPDTAPRGTADVLALADDLRAVLTVAFVPLADAVAVLDTTSSSWSLDLDSDSPAEDQCWAMDDVLRVLRHGAPAAEHATSRPPLRPLSLVADIPAPRPRPADEARGRLTPRACPPEDGPDR